MEKSIVKQGFPPRNAETRIGKLVRFLVFASAFIVAAGGVFYLLRVGNVASGYHLFQGEPVWLRSPEKIAAGALSLHALSLIQLGILLLIAIPIVRVSAFLASFSLHRDWIYSIISLTVLCLLLFSLFGAGPG
jgi:uncharacterized membrane protein